MSGAALDIIKGVYTVAKAIYDQVEQAKTNQAQCKTLAKRIGIIEQAIRDLNDTERSELLKPALEDLVQCLEEVLRWMKQCGEAGWLKRVWKARDHQAQFPRFAERLQQSMQQLGIGLGAQLLVNQEQDKKDQQEDRDYVKSHLEEMADYQEKAFKAVQHLDEKQAAHQSILKRQMAAYQRELLAALQRLQPVSLVKEPVGEAKLGLDADWMIAYSDLEFDFSQRLSHGVLGEVYRGQWQSQPVAIKVLAGVLSPGEQKQFMREARVLSRLRNEHIIQLYGVSLEDQQACLVTEYLPEGSLAEYVRRQTLTPLMQKSLALDIVRGLHYLHMKKVLHGDLRSATILISRAGRAKLAELGLARTQSKSLASLHETTPGLASCAPEVLQRHPEFSEASDVYSLGTVLWELLTGRVAYANFGEGLRDALLQGKRESLAGIPAVYAEMIKGCWEGVPSQRPSLPRLIGELERYEPPVAQVKSLSVGLLGDDLREEGLVAEQKGDLTQARRCYQQAISAGSIKALTSLGMFAWKGQGGEAQDAKQAYRLFKQAAEGGHERGIYNVAYLLEAGEGVPRDLKAALRWYAQLVNGSGYAESLRQKAQERMKKIEQRYGITLSTSTSLEGVAPPSSASPTLITR